MRPLLVGLALLALAGCTRPTELVIVVDSDLAIPSELDEVVVTITGPSGQPVEARQALADGPELPLTLGVTPSGEGLGPIDIVAQGLLEGEVVVTRTARTSLIAGRSLALYLFLARDCRGLECDAGETCTENGCAPSFVDPETLPDWNGSVRGPDGGADAAVQDGGGTGDAGPPPPCETGSDCDDGVDCTRDVCSDGACSNLADDALCTVAEEGTCDAANGCQYPTCSEATCVAGPCQTAACDGDTCVRTSLCESGQSCCNGECVPAGCDDGNVCTDDACGATGCENVANTVSCADDTFCNGAEVCAGGTCTSPGSPCSGSAICDESANVCTGCVVDADCGAPVIGGWSACGGFDPGCDETGTRSRSVTTYTCQSGSCVGSPSTETESCTRDTDGNECGTTSCGSFGACGGFSGTCDESGSQTRTCTDYACAAGACQPSTRSDSQSCSRSTAGMTCQATSCTDCSGSCTYADECDESGSCSSTCTDYTCGGGTCNGANRTESRSCSRNTDGNTCEDGLFCTEGDQCGGGYCSAGFDTCGPGCTCVPGSGGLGGRCLSDGYPREICTLQ